MFFDLKKAKQQASDSAVYSEQEKAELIKNYHVLEDKFKNLSEKIVEYRRNNPVPVQLESNHLFIEICDIINLCHKTFPKQNDPAHVFIRFFKSNIGMKCFVLMKKVELLLLKVVNQEWFPIETLRLQYDQNKILQPLSTIYPKDTPVDETFYLFGVYDSQLSYAAYVPQIAKDIVRPTTKENIIAATLFLFNRLRDCPILSNDLKTYANNVFVDYELAKTAYTTASPVSENPDELHYDAHKNAYSYLGKTFTEHEFDWFEDIETNIPIHLGNFLKALKVIVDFDILNKDQSSEILDECIKADPKNIYIHYLKATCLEITTSTEKDLTIAHNNYSNAIHHLEKAMAYLSSSPLLPLPKLSKTNFSHETEEPEKHVERINDLKFTPVSLVLASIYARAAECGVSVELRHLYGGKGIDYIRQTELYSRFPNSPAFYMTKGSCYYACDLFELSLNAYSAIEQFESVLDPTYIIDSLTYAANGMIALGFSDKCLEAMDYYIEKYESDPRLLYQKILCKDYMCRSKDELRQVLKDFEQLKDSIADLSITNPYIYQRVTLLIDSRIHEISETIKNPQVAENW